MKISAFYFLIFGCIFSHESLQAQQKNKLLANYYFFVRPVHAGIEMKEQTVGEKPKTISVKKSFHYLLYIETKCNTKPVISSVTINGRSFHSSVKKLSSPVSIPDMPTEKKLMAGASNAFYQLTELEVINGLKQKDSVTHIVIIKGKLKMASFTISDTAKLLPPMAAQ